MNDGAVGGIAKGVSDSRNVRSAPLADRITLSNLFGDKVPEDRKLAGEVVIDADDFFLQISRNIGAAHELISLSWRREKAGGQERLSIRA